MKLTQQLLLLFAIIFVSSYSHAQTWSGILDPTRAVNWQRANIGVAGGIPTNYTQCGSTVAAGATSATINSLIAGCAQNTYLLLGSGTFTLNAGLNLAGKSHFYVSGSGPNQTYVSFTGGVSCYSGNDNVCLRTASLTWEGTMPGNDKTAQVSGSYAQGATQITVTNVVGPDGIAQGDMIILDQPNDTVNSLTGFIVCDTTGAFPNACSVGSSGTGRVIGGVTYSQQQYVRVTACSPSCPTSGGAGPYTLTISPGLYDSNWGAAGKQIQAWWTKPTTYIGVENMTLDFSGNSSASSGINITDCDQCWVKNIRSIDAKQKHINSELASHVEIRDSYFYGTQNQASESYGILYGYGSGDSLVENNVFQQVASPILGGGEGNVFAYNFSIDDIVNSSSFAQGTYFSHDAGASMDLWEGNVFMSLFTDQLHGSSGLVTAFRNWLNGLDWNTCTASGGTCLNTNNFANHPSEQVLPVELATFIRGMNLIGNVLGTPGFHTIYEEATPAAGGCNDKVIYSLGYSNTCGGNGGVPDDTVVKQSLMRWGNYDTVNAAVRWDATESSPGAVSFINANKTPSSHTLPASFYLSGKPSWFGSVPFPPIGPDVTSGNGGTFTSGTYSQGICPVGFASGGATCSSTLAGLVNVIPAMNCYFNVMHGPTDGSGNVLGFDANSCYSSSSNNGPPPPPAPSRVVR